MIDIRPIRPQEVVRFRELRLTALKDSPKAYGSTSEAEGLMSMDAWKAWVAERPERLVLVAEEGGKFVGTVSAAPYQGHADAFVLFALWVAPAQRRTGLGRRLVETVLTWAATTARNRVFVHVAADNEPSFALFRALGFKDTGQRLTLREDLPIETSVLERALETAASA